MVSVRRTNHPRENDMTRCIAILALALTSTLFADQSSAEEIVSVYDPACVLNDGYYYYWEVLVDMGFSPEEADYSLLRDAPKVPYDLFSLAKVCNAGLILSWDDGGVTAEDDWETPVSY